MRTIVQRLQWAAERLDGHMAQWDRSTLDLSAAAPTPTTAPHVAPDSPPAARNQRNSRPAWIETQPRGHHPRDTRDRSDHSAVTSPALRSKAVSGRWLWATGECCSVVQGSVCGLYVRSARCAAPSTCSRRLRGTPTWAMWCHHQRVRGRDGDSLLALRLGRRLRPRSQIRERERDRQTDRERRCSCW